MLFSVHLNTLNNIQNSTVSRNFRSLIDPDIYFSEAFAEDMMVLHATASTFLRDLPTVTDHGAITLEQWVATRSTWGSNKKRKILMCDIKKDIKGYVTETFVKNEVVFKSPLKAPRLIHNPRTEIKARYGPVVFHYTSRIKKHLTVESVYNEHTKHIHFVWTSGMNRCQIGREMEAAYDRIRSAGYEVELVCADYSKFEATQHPAILSILLKIIRNTSADTTREMMLEHERLIIGQKSAYARTKYDLATVKYVFNGTRTSGDLTTTVGNTLLAMCIMEHIYVGEKDFVYLFQAGDDAFMLGPKGFARDIDLDFIKRIGMKLDVLHAPSPPLCDYNSSCFIRARVDGVLQYILAPKIGRLLTKCGIATVNTENMNHSQFGSFRFQKALSMAQESILWPGVSRFYKRVANEFQRYSTVKLFDKYTDLVFVGEIEPTLETYEDLAVRYGIAREEVDALNSAFDTFEPNILSLNENSAFAGVAHIVARCVKVDVGEYSLEEIDSFVPYFNPTVVANYLAMVEQDA